MLTTESPDGTRIAYWRSGAGPPLLLVHGAMSDHAAPWQEALSLLERRFTVYAMDRRGRGGSGDAIGHDLNREAEDVAAVLRAIGGAVDVVGHSFGGLCALEAARLGPAPRRLVLYEAVPLRGAEGYPTGFVDRLERMLAAGDREGVLLSVMRELIGRPEEEIERLRGQREAWAARLATAGTVPRELRAEAAYVFDAARFRGMRTPTLLLVGGASDRREADNAAGVAASLPDARVAVLAGQRHTAMLTAPELFTRAVTEFLAP